MTWSLIVKLENCFKTPCTEDFIDILKKHIYNVDINSQLDVCGKQSRNFYIMES